MECFTQLSKFGFWVAGWVLAINSKHWKILQGSTTREATRTFHLR